MCRIFFKKLYIHINKYIWLYHQIVSLFKKVGYLGIRTIFWAINSEWPLRAWSSWFMNRANRNTHALISEGGKIIHVSFRSLPSSRYGRWCIRLCLLQWIVLLLTYIDILKFWRVPRQELGIASISWWLPESALRVPQDYRAIGDTEMRIYAPSWRSLSCPTKASSKLLLLDPSF